MDGIVNKAEAAESFLTHETKQQSKQLLKKGKPGPVSCLSEKNKATVFFDSFSEI
jgi:hypothetical protein